MGLAITPEYDELLARGYPHLRRLVTPHPDDDRAHDAAIQMLNLGDPRHYFVDWPAAVARRYVRGYAVSRIENTSPPKMHAAAIDGPPGMAARPLDEAEGRKLIASYLHADHYDRYDFHAHHALFLIEAMIGSAATADAVLGEFEAMKNLQAKYGTRNALAYALGFVIRRLPAAQRAKAEARVQALVAKHAGGGENYTRDFLSYLVGGREALENSGRKLGLYCVHFCNDPALIRSVADGLVTGWDAQHVVLAGDALIDALTPKKLRQIWQPWRPLVIEQLGVLASPKVVAVLEELGKTKAFAAQVQAVLAARGGAAAKQPAEDEASKKPAPERPAAKQVATKQVAAKKPVATKQVAAKPAAKQVAAKQPVATKQVAVKPAAKQVAAKQPVATKQVAVKPAAKQVAAKQPVAAKQVAAKQVAAKPAAKQVAAKQPVATKQVAAKQPVAAKQVAAKQVAAKQVATKKPFAKPAAKKAAKKKR